MVDQYNPFNWYWSVTDSSPSTQVYSTIDNAFVALSNAGYVAWLANGNSPTTIATIAALRLVLSAYNLTLFLPASTTVSSMPTTLTNPLASKIIVSAAGNLTLPAMNTTGSIPLGQAFEIENTHATGDVVVKDNGGSTILTLKAADRAKLVLASNATAAGTFTYNFTRKVGSTSLALGLTNDFMRNEGRLSVSNTDPTADVASGSTVYLMPFRGELISLYLGGEWVTRVFDPTIASVPASVARVGSAANGANIITGLSRTDDLSIGMHAVHGNIPGSTSITSIDSASQVTISANTTGAIVSASITFRVVDQGAVDVFAYAAGTDNQETWLQQRVWTNNTTRAVALTLQDGVYVKSGDTGKRYLGTYVVDGHGTVKDTPQHRLIWNYYNRVGRVLHMPSPGSSYTYGTATWRAMNSSGGASSFIIFAYGILENEEMLLTMNVPLQSPGAASHVTCGMGTDGSSGVAPNIRQRGLIHETANANWQHILPVQARYVPAVAFNIIYAKEITDGSTWTFMGGADIMVGNPWRC